MITVDQIQLLESRVTKAVRKIEALQDENETLRDRLARYEKRIEELEVLINEFKDSQNDIEQGILNALSQLDELEDQVTGETASQAEGAAANDTRAGVGPAPESNPESETPRYSEGTNATQSPEAPSSAPSKSESSTAQHNNAAPSVEHEQPDGSETEEDQGVELDIF
ncbi:MAG: cell division protein ZapB [Spirochaetales bacterium]